MRLAWADDKTKIQQFAKILYVKIMEFGYSIYNPYEKCIQKSPNMPGIG